MSLAIALAQIQMRPKYHPSYDEQLPRNTAGRPVTKLHIERKEKLLAISKEIGEAQLCDLIAVMHKTDAKLHKDDCRKLLNELVEEKKLDKRILYVGGKKALYKWRQA